MDDVPEMTGLSQAPLSLAARHHQDARGAMIAELHDKPFPRHDGESPAAYWARRDLEIARSIATWDEAYPRPRDLPQGPTLAQMKARDVASPWKRG